MVDLERMLTDLEILLGPTVTEAFGPPGVSGDPERIVYAARKIAELYRTAISWSIDCYRYQVDQEYRRFMELLSELPSDIVAQIEAFPGRVEKACEEMIQAGGGRQNLVLKVTLPDMTELYKEKDRLLRMIKHPD